MIIFPVLDFLAKGHQLKEASLGFFCLISLQKINFSGIEQFGLSLRL